MRREHNLTPDQIRRVEIGLHRNGITLTGDAVTKRHPTSIVGGQFSMFFTGAVALDQGRFGWDDYERLGDAAVDGARGQVRRRAGRSARNRPATILLARVSASPPTTACTSGSMPIPRASRTHSRTRRRWRRKKISHPCTSGAQWPCRSARRCDLVAGTIRSHRDGKRISDDSRARLVTALAVPSRLHDASPTRQRRGRTSRTRLQSLRQAVGPRLVTRRFRGRYSE